MLHPTSPNTFLQRCLRTQRWRCLLQGSSLTALSSSTPVSLKRTLKLRADVYGPVKMTSVVWKGGGGG